MINTKIKLSALWLFILLNIIFRDLHQLGMAWYLEMLLTGRHHGVEVTDGLMVLGFFVAEIPIAMVLLSLLLTRGVCRPITGSWTMAVSGMWHMIFSAENCGA